MEKPKLKPTEISSQKDLKPSTLEKGQGATSSVNISKKYENPSEVENTELKKAENKLLQDRDYGDLEI